jgi:hypothetical protein
MKGETPPIEMAAMRDAEIVIVCTTPTPRGGLVTELSATGHEVHAVGECGGARYVEAVMRNATEVALDL